MKGHLIEYQKNKIRDSKSREKIELEYVIRQGEEVKKKTKQITKDFQETLARRKTPRGEWGTEATSSSSARRESVPIKFLTDEICA
ncbi:hypothetical protein, partial [Salmonella sp. s51228]|uniref:hypothetical protein n=1 Tax=Salmonella sp. s51228 TaxID=3159652 RepID=UPI00397FAE30